MKIYFSAAIFQRDKFGDSYLEIIKILQEFGHEVRHEHITDHTLKFVLEQSTEDLKKYYKKFSAWMRQSDIIVIEASFPSTVNIGHEITLALSKNKPVIVLYQQDLKPTMLVSIENENLICIEYTPITLETNLGNALDYVSSQIDVRFNLFLPAKMSQYIEIISKEEKISKSHFIRSLIKKHMQENPITAPSLERG